MSLAAELDRAQSALQLAMILDDVERTLRRYVVFRSPAQSATATLWVAHTHALEAFDVTPYLNVRSAEKGSGKTRLLEVVHELVPRAWHAIQPTEAVLFRRIHRDTPTLLLDESDTVFAKTGSTDRAEAVRGVLNAGYRRGATVDRVNLKAKETLESYKVFCAKAFAGIGTLPGTVADRSIPIELARRLKTEHVARFFLRDIAPTLHAVRARLATWAEEAIGTLRVARPALPDELPDRAAEVWEPLLGIADLAGGDWPERARKAAIELHVGRTDTDSHGVALLRAIREVFYPRPAKPGAAPPDPIKKLSTLDLLRALVDREQEPWPGWWGSDVDKALRDGVAARKPGRELAGLLKPYGVTPKDIRTDDGTRKGYEPQDFADPWLRYLEPLSRDNATTLGGQGETASRGGNGKGGNATRETLAGVGVSRCRVTEAEIRPTGATDEWGAL